MQPRQLRQQSSASAPSVPAGNGRGNENFEDVDDGHSDVGFDNSTVLLYDTAHQPTNKSSDGPGGGGTASASPYARYEPVYAPQQQNVLGYALPDDRAITAAGWSGGSVFPAPDVSCSQPPRLHSHQQPPLMPPPYANPALLRPPSTVSGLGILGSGITVGGVSRPPTSSTFLPLTTVTEPAATTTTTIAGGGAPVISVSAEHDALKVPLHAPRLRVPANLPLEQTTLLDLLATAVVQGGPTTEEEIVRREVSRGNPAFSFLSDKFNHPCMLYYRWRLYSLLQGDTLLSWRTQPFQIEEARRAYVWVPPPPLKVGPECLVGLHQPELLDPLFPASGSGDAAAPAGGAEEEDGADVILRTARRRHRRRHSHHHHHHRDTDDETNYKRSRHETGDGSGHRSHHHIGGGSTSSSGSNSSMRSSSSSSSDDDKQDEAKGSGPRSAESGDGNAITAKIDRQPIGLLPADSGAEAPPSEAAADPTRIRLPPPSAQWISRQCTAHRHVFSILQPHLLAEWTALLNPYAIADPATVGDNLIATLCERWLQRSEIATRMMFAIRHVDAIHHLLSILLDAVVKVAYVATARSRQQTPDSANSFDSNVYCVEALWYLFVLHDIAMNASNTPELAAASVTSVNRNVSTRPQPLQPQQAVPATAGMMSGVASAGQSDMEEELFISEGSSEALEALYDVLNRQRLAARAGGGPTPTSPAAAGGAAPVSSATTVSSPPSSALRPTPRPRRRQRQPQRRSSYERCGDALEMILPTLMEACTATALAVSMDKERQRSQSSATAPTAAARVRHFKVLPPPQHHHQQQQQRSKPKKQLKAAENDSLAAPSPSSTALPIGGGPALSLKLDAGCDTAPAVASTSSSPSLSTPPPPSPSAGGKAITGASGGADSVAPSTSSTSSAPAVMLLHWLKALITVWMNVEQPLQLPPSPAFSAAAGIAGGPNVPVGTVWPDCQTDAADMPPEVILTYHVDPQHMSLLGLDAASQQQRGVHHQPPLLSARACAIMKDRYAFLF
ncbi:hypothetical protein JKF63_07389 [Porcisia hertigi]|uniref:SURP motif domain-containing protein n=1 Tax=Porcisia hertigi TaxID=2761500 RepID=A0A836YHY6_9TRYP|nr:hypothetical protein JKF63_07389 [Porcisia hertigi]